MREVRYALRSLLRTPGVTCVAVTVLALGLGTTTAMFTVANAVLLRPLPFADADRLVQIGSVGLLEFRAFREQGHAIAALASYSTANKTLASAEPERIVVVTAEAGLFDLLGTPALAGRTFHVGDPEDVVVLGERFWRRRFAARPPTEDWTISLDGKVYLVVGVMPEAFQFPYRSEAMDVWIPAALPRVDSPFQRIDAAVGRLSPTATLDAVRAELVAIASRTGLRNVSVDPIPISSLTDAVVGPARRMVLTLFGGVLMVLTAACATAANLLLARAESRRRDIAIRRALGAGSARLVTTFLTESLLLAAASTLGALLIAVAATHAVLAPAAAALPRASEIGLSPMTIVFLVALALGAAIACGSAPAFIAMKRNAAAALGASDDRLPRTPRSAAIQDALVITEIALAVVLTIGAGLIVRAFVALRDAPVGLIPAGVLTLRVETRGLVPETASGPTGTDSTAQGRYFQAIEDRVRQVPGVTAAGFVTRLHVQSPGNTGRYTIAGRPVSQTDRDGRIVRLREASPGYFQALGVPVRAGRLFDARTGGILVNEAFAREHVQGEDAVGLALNRGTIVGVVGDVRQRLRTQAEPEIYASIAATSYSAATLVVKAAVPPEALIAPVRAAVRELNANQTVFDVRTMDEVVAAAYADVGFALRLAGFSSALAILLSMAGVYAVLSANVGARRREFGIRLALGADPRRLLRMVAARAAAIITVGTAIGVVGALALTRFLRSLLYEVGPGDPGTFAAATLVFTIVAAIAGLAPARRALTVDPLTVLRHE